MAPQFSSGLNMPNKNSSGPKPANAFGQKRKKNIFDDDSGEEDKQNDGAMEISAIGGLDVPVSKSKPSSDAGPPPKRKLQMGLSGKPGAKPLNKCSIFAHDEEDDEEKEKERQGEVRFGLNQRQSKNPTGLGKDYKNLSALHSSKKYAEEAEELDPSIYSYDAVYDSLHAKDDKSATANKSEVPKYMTNLLRSAEIRKRDQTRARDRQLAKEREAEGDEFADKESFVTGAYKAQQEEIRKMEEEEERKEKEEEERRKQNGGAGMVGFYRDVLSRGEAKHEQAVKAAEEAARRVKTSNIDEGTTKEAEEMTETQKAENLNARGAHIAINDEGQVVDKRQLLSAGLNVAPKPKAAPSAAPTSASRPSAGRPGAGAGYQTGRAAQRARQTEMIATQLEEQARREEEAEAAKQKEIAEKIRSRKTVTDVSSAKERYLARKREREEAAAKEKAGK
ncbi:uncharacterized protein N7482_010432 [Penicillium canariense]|uniref:Nuclear speckle splicing regulatory protein 1 N-terminal domain-containing protein n=1 Tax=Penicillium canariense TaxID=189055 RepID=A0A9W9HM20_9EURO|nr:uncharacterized protein N7482_010432 [Penicillium canariense]KAJ5151180.1 hypothetical protein N7482_010432 [Penicillium canariense]